MNLKIFHRPRIIILLAIVLLIPSLGFAAVSVAQEANPRIYEISGTISSTDVPVVKKVLEDLQKNKISPIFRLNTTGGDIISAIEIGRQLRKYRAIAMTYEQGKCYSACIYILSGAVRRVLTKAVGIHRPYSTDTSNRDFQTIQKESKNIAMISRKYFEEMNISSILFDDMMAISPENIKILTEDDFQKYGLLSIDPVEQEIDDAFQARKYKITKQEFLRRKSRADYACNPLYLYGTNTGDFIYYKECLDEVLSGKKQ